jgi:hypothetical protein
MLNIGQWESAEDRIAIKTSRELNVALKREIIHVQFVGKQLDLAVAIRSRHQIVNFLQEHDIWILPQQRLHNSLWPIATIDTADALVNVVRDNPQRTRVPVFVLGTID